MKLTKLILAPLVATVLALPTAQAANIVYTTASTGKFGTQLAAAKVAGGERAIDRV